MDTYLQGIYRQWDSRNASHVNSTTTFISHSDLTPSYLPPVTIRRRRRDSHQMMALDRAGAGGVPILSPTISSSIQDHNSVADLTMLPSSDCLPPLTPNMLWLLPTTTTNNDELGSAGSEDHQEAAGTEPSSPPSSSPKTTTTTTAKKSRQNLPKHATRVLKEWLYAHYAHPYPEEHEKDTLARRANISSLQLSNWFINARRRALHRHVSAEGAKHFTIHHRKPSSSSSSTAKPKKRRTSTTTAVPPPSTSSLRS